VKRLLLVSVLLFSFVTPAYAETGDVIGDETEIVKAKTVRIISETEEEIQGTGVSGIRQTVEAAVLEGTQKGKTVTFENDYIKLEEGDIFYLLHNIRGEDGYETYSVSDPHRLPAVYFFAGLFVLLVILIGGWQGIRGLVSLLGSFVLIIYMLLPGILAGYPPVLVAIAVSSLIIVVGSYITHGFNKTTSAAVIGMIITVIFTGLLAFWSVGFAKLTGYSSDEVSYLVVNTQGEIDIIGILLGGIMIGVLGILYDVAIGQAIAVEELKEIAPHVSRRKIYFRALRMGREHIGALVNTLAIAYVGVSLPLLLLFTQFETSFTQMANREIFTTEIIRTLIGSIGLMLAVPITTLLAVIMLIKKKDPENPEVLKKEVHALEHFEHHHH